MSQKANLLTIRRKNRVELITHNSKIWATLYVLIENISRLFFLRGVWLLKNFCGFDNNLVCFNFFLFYQKSKLSALKKKIIKKKKKINIYLKNNSFVTFLRTYIDVLNFNFFEFSVSNLNLLVNRKKLRVLYIALKPFAFNIFSRRFNFFIDFSKITILFLENHINLSSYINIWSLVFKNLHKRLHSKFFTFVKTCMQTLLKFKSYKKELALFGVKFLLSGRIRGKSRASSRIIKLGNVPAQTIKKNVEFASRHVYTLYGIYGIKIWTYKK